MREASLSLRTLVAIAWIWLAGCGFRDGKAQPDAAGPMITVAFQTSMETQDHTSGTVQIPVVLSQASTAPVTVTVQVDAAATTAVVGTDYQQLDPVTLTFAPGTVVQTVPVTFIYTAMASADTTLALQLAMPTGAKVGGTSEHTITISAIVLPRVQFATTDPTNGMEMNDAMVHVVMTTSSPVTTTVDFVTTGSTAVQGTSGVYDYTLVPATLTFAPGTTMQTIDLGIHRDNQFNADVAIMLTLQNATKMVIGTPASTSYTINEQDMAPVVAFTTTAASAAESAGSGTNAVVSILHPSRQTLTVPVTIGGTGTLNTNFTVSVGGVAVNASPFNLTFPGGTGGITQTIVITPIDDGTADNGYAPTFTIGTPTGGTATLGANTVYTFTISDADQTCLGGGAYHVCVQKPSAALTLPATINTDALTCGTQFSGWTGQPSSCFLIATNITTNTAVSVYGSRPLVLIASGNITISNNLDVSSHLGGTIGPGAPSSLCTASPAGGNSATGGAGGAGASFMSKGGDGGNGNGNNMHGSAVNADGSNPTVLRAGCNGGLGGNGSGAPGAVGPGGGAVYLLAGGTIMVASGAAINASGAAGAAAAAGTMNSAGGSGAGTGGMIKLEAATISVSGATLMANGGGGASGAQDNGNGTAGSDPSAGAPTSAASGGNNGNPAGGGNGFAQGTNATGGSNGGSSHNQGGGGGGGGGGFIETNHPLTGATTSAGVCHNC